METLLTSPNASLISSASLARDSLNAGLASYTSSTKAILDSG